MPKFVGGGESVKERRVGVTYPPGASLVRMAGPPTRLPTDGAVPNDDEPRVSRYAWMSTMPLRGKGKKGRKHEDGSESEDLGSPRRSAVVGSRGASE